MESKEYDFTRIQERLTWITSRLSDHPTIAGRLPWAFFLRR